jgi:hypothetical protein
MTPTVSFTVMGHTARQQQARRLARDLSCPAMFDTPELGLGEVANGNRAWACARHADWHAVLQDDALLVPGFLEALPRALAAADHSIVSLYTGTGRPLQRSVESAIRVADARGWAWLEHRTLLWGVAVAMPTGLAPDFLAWGAGQPGPYDERIGRFARERRIPVLYTHPSLVDHADGPTLLQHKVGPPTAPRRAHRLGTAADYTTPAAVIR